MGVFRRLYNRYIRPRKYERSKRAHFEALLSKGVGPAQANRLVKELSSINPENRKGIRPAIANRWAKEFQRKRQTTLTSLPKQIGGRITASMATPSEFKSPAAVGHRYLVDFRFKAINPETGLQTTFYNTLGFQKLSFRGIRVQTKGQLLNVLKQRIKDLHNIAERYYPTGFIEPDLDSIDITGFYRTLNP